MSPLPLIVDGTELLADAVDRFAAAVADSRFADAERFAALAFYLIAHQVEP